MISGILKRNISLISGIVLSITLNTAIVSALPFHGIISDTLQRPVGNALVQLHDPFNGVLMYSAASDTSGYFEFADIGEMEYHLRISGQSYPDQWFSFTGNTVYKQYRLRIGVASTIDTLFVTMVQNPADNPANNILVVNLADSLGEVLGYTGGSIYVVLLRKLDGYEMGGRYFTGSSLQFDTLQPAEYAIMVQGGVYPQQYHHPVRNTERPDHYVAIAGADAETLTVKMYDPPTGYAYLHGVVTNESDLPLAGVTVSLCMPYDTFKTVYAQTTTTAGKFAFANIRDMDYFVKLNGGGFGVQWFSRTRNATTLYPDDFLWPMHYASDTVTIRCSSTPVNNPPVGMIRMSVYDSSETVQIASGTIALISVSDNTVYTPGIDSLSQHYVAENLPVGMYYVKLVFPYYPLQYYAPSGNTENPSYPISVAANNSLLYTIRLSSTPGQYTTGNMQGKIWGNVRDSAGVLGGTTVSVFDRNGMLLATATTTSDGMFSPLSFPPQEVYVSLQHPSFVPHFWTRNSMKTALSDSVYFFVTPYDSVAVDALLYKRYDGSTIPVQNSTISGSVVDATTLAKLSSVRVVLFDGDAGSIVSTKQIWSPWSATTDASGLFTISNVPFGEYRCFAEADTFNYITQFYPKTDLYSAAKIIVVDSTSGTLKLDFSLRKGAILLGKVTDVNGAPLPDVRIACSNLDNTRNYETMTKAGGDWKISGILKGTWNVWAGTDRYLVVSDTVKRTFSLSEGQTVTVPNFRMEQGGFVSGTFTSPVSFYDTTGGQMMHYGELHSFSVQNKANEPCRPVFTGGMYLHPTATDGTAGEFFSSGMKSGTFVLLFAPQPRMTGDGVRPLLPGLGYSFFSGSGTSTATTIAAGDSTRDVSLALRKGYAISGTIKTEAGTPLTGTYGVDVFVKRDTLLYRIAHSSLLSNGMFELPGLIDNEEYYLQLWAETYPPQFWAPESTTMQPSKAFLFSAATYTPLQCTIFKSIKGMGGDDVMQSPVSLSIAGDSSGFPLLAWQKEQGLSVDTFILFNCDRTGKADLITKIPASAATGYSYRHTGTSGNYREYVITAKSTVAIVRSNRVSYDPRQTSGIPLWLGSFINRWGIGLEWGCGKNVSFTEKDSVAVFRQISNESPKLLFKCSARNSTTEDHVWNRTDSGKTYTYHIEIPSKGLISPSVTFTLSAAFFAQLPKTHVVGPYERYQRIAEAIAAAADGDRIEIRSGTYTGNISLMGKNIALEGRWDYGKPPVLDGGGGTAITIPFCKTVAGWNRPRVSGFAIKNSATGIKSSSPVEVEACLFENVSLAVSMAIDSAAQVQWMLAYPFASSKIDAHVNHCTFIAKKGGNLIAAVTAAGKAEYDGTLSGGEFFYVQPAQSLSSSVYINGSIVAYYQSGGLQNMLPVTIQGVSSTVHFSRSDFWKTSVAPKYTSSTIDSMCVYKDPLFTDTATWFLSASSPLAGRSYDTRFGYDVRLYDYKDGTTGGKRPAALKNVISRTVGLTTVFISWTPSPAVDSVVRYRIYRLPGEPSHYYINQFSQWDIKIPEDSLFKIVDTFSTDKNAFLDTTAKSGIPYLYIVTAIGSDGEDGDVDFPAPPDISTYFVNKPADRITIPAQRWQMIGIVGSGTVTLGTESTHALFGWNDKNPADKLYAHYFKNSQMQSTGGYWFKPSVDTTITIPSTAIAELAATEKTAAIPLVKGATGWNLVSSPFPFEIQPSWLDAFDAWEWNPDSAGYRKARLLKPWKAYWMYASKDTVLPLWKKQSLAEYLAAPLAKTQASAVAWKLQLSLRAGNSHDIDNFIGVLRAGRTCSELYDSREPPAPFDGARCAILGKKESSGKSAETYAEQYLEAPKHNDRSEWIVTIGASAQPSLLQIAGINDAPKKLHLFWIEKERIVNLREQQSISFAASNSEHSGVIVATADAADLALYTGKLQLRTPFPNPSRGAATLEYTLPYEWQGSSGIFGSGGVPVRLELFDIAGRVVATIVDDIKKPGVYRTVWSGKNRAGYAVVPGMYFLKLSSNGNHIFVRFCRVL